MDRDRVVEGYRVIEWVEGEMLDEGYGVYVYIIEVGRVVERVGLVGCEDGR